MQTSQENLDLNTVIYEICKFFLYAHIRPQIAPQPSTHFRYYFAVADGVSKDAFEFCMHQGKDDLTKDLSYSKKNVEKFSEIQKSP